MLQKAGGIGDMWFRRVRVFIVLMWKIRHNLWQATRMPQVAWIFIMGKDASDCEYMYRKLNETFVMLQKERASKLSNTNIKG
jgi:hypothetical protein